MARVLRWQIVVLFFAFCLPVLADDGEEREALRIEIEQLRESGRLSIGGIDVASGNLLADFYERRGFSPAWSDTGKIESLIEVIKATARDGLDPSDYHLEDIEHVNDLLENGRQLTPEERAALDIALTDSLFRLGYHQRFGKVDPYDLDPEWNFSRELHGKDPAEAIQEAIDAESLPDYLTAIFPRVELYRRLQSYLEEYRKLAASGGWPHVPEGSTLKPGAADERLPILARRLAITGDLPAAAAAAPVSVYADALESAVRNFQERHGLDADGVVGPATLRALNVPVEDRVNQIRLNLERGRWVLDDLEDDFVVVNIAGFRAYLYRDRKPVWSTRVVVGKTYHKTPVFRSLMKYVVFNPTWTVPYSIATKEMLPAIQRDPNYLSARNFDVKDRNGEIVDPASVDWSQVTRRNFGYTFVQRPGVSNALGEIKFIFPNQHSVYLHDTPSKSLFERAERTFSHGCIRVDRPFDFAEVLLQQDGWNREMIDAEIAGRNTRSVFLSQPMPVLLLYWTAEIGADGQIHFYDDVYERDQKILTALDSPYRVNIPES
jgi:murein L,D-transpeptidase YcbB/YkuD